MTHQVTVWAPSLSDTQPPSARITPEGSTKMAAISAAVRISKPYSLM